MSTILLNNDDHKKILKAELDDVLQRSILDESNPSGVHAIVAGVTNRQETVYLRSLGFSDPVNKNKVQKDTKFALYSCTKALTSTAILQLWERGLIDLDAPAKIYLPQIGKVGVFEGYNNRNERIFREPKVDITMRMLLTHTAGFSYPASNIEYQKEFETNSPPILFNSQHDTLDRTFLIFEPGSKWHYGMNIDWAGRILEAITGKSLGEYLKENIFVPAKLDSFTFHIKDSNEVEIKMCLRKNNSLLLHPHQAQLNPPLEMGGTGLFGTIEDYLKFIRIWLNEGKTSDGFPIINKETYKYAIKNHLTSEVVQDMPPSTDKSVCLDIEADASLEPDNWCLISSKNECKQPTGRPKGSLHWSGIANLFYWIDLKNRIGGMWATQILPFGGSSLDHFENFESATYKIISKIE